MSAYTPGPWFVDRNHVGKIMGVASPKTRHYLEFVAECQDEANARLIAAAPELLESCKRALITFPCGREYDEARDIIRSAIAKADGRIMNAHTPGPWVAMADSLEIMAADHKIADTSFYYGKHDEQDEANARLIAAAPELLESCKRALITFPCGREYDEARDIIRSAIAKAEGKA